MDELCKAFLVRVESYEGMDALVGSIVGCDFRMEMQLALVIVLFQYSYAGIIAGRLDRQCQ